MRLFLSFSIYLKSRESSSAKQVTFAFFLIFWSSSFNDCFDHWTLYNFFWCFEWFCLCNTVISGVHLYETFNRLLALGRYGDWLPKSLYIEKQSVWEQSICFYDSFAHIACFLNFFTLLSLKKVLLQVLKLIPQCTRSDMKTNTAWHFPCTSAFSSWEFSSWALEIPHSLPMVLPCGKGIKESPSAPFDPV